MVPPNMSGTNINVHPPVDNYVPPLVDNRSDYIRPATSNDFAPYTMQPNDHRYVFVPNLGVYLLPYEYLNLSNPYDQWMYSHFPSYYGEYYDNYWPFDDSVGGAKYIDGSNNSVGGAKYINSFNDSHWNRRQGNRQNRQNAGRYWDEVGSPDKIDGNRWSSYDKKIYGGNCQKN